MAVYAYFDAVCTHFIIQGLGICNMPNECEIIRHHKFSNPLILNVLDTGRLTYKHLFEVYILSVINVFQSISNYCLLYYSYEKSRGLLIENLHDTINKKPQKGSQENKTII